MMQQSFDSAKGVQLERLPPDARHCLRYLRLVLVQCQDIMKPSFLPERLQYAVGHIFSMADHKLQRMI